MQQAVSLTRGVYLNTVDEEETSTQEIKNIKEYKELWDPDEDKQVEARCIKIDDDVSGRQGRTIFTTHTFLSVDFSS